jgi:hypothetical protein
MANFFKAIVFAFLEHLVPSALHLALGTKAVAGERIERESTTEVITISNFFLTFLLYYLRPFRNTSRNGLKGLANQPINCNYQLSGLKGDGAGAEVSTAGAAGAATFGADFFEDFFLEDFFLADFFLAVFFFFATFFFATFFLEDFFADFFLATLRFAVFFLEDFFADFFFDTLRLELFLLELFFDFLRAATYPPYGVELLPIFSHYSKRINQSVPSFFAIF